MKWAQVHFTCIAGGFGAAAYEGLCSASSLTANMAGPGGPAGSLPPVSLVQTVVLVRGQYLIYMEYQGSLNSAFFCAGQKQHFISKITVFVCFCLES